MKMTEKIEQKKNAIINRKNVQSALDYMVGKELVKSGEGRGNIMFSLKT